MRFRGCTSAALVPRPRRPRSTCRQDSRAVVDLGIPASQTASAEPPAPPRLPTRAKRSRGELRQHSARWLPEGTASCRGFCSGFGRTSRRPLVQNDHPEHYYAGGAQVPPDRENASTATTTAPSPCRARAHAHSRHPSPPHGSSVRRVPRHPRGRHWPYPGPGTARWSGVIGAWVQPEQADKETPRTCTSEAIRIRDVSSRTVLDHIRHPECPDMPHGQQTETTIPTAQIRPGFDPRVCLASKHCI